MSRRRYDREPIFMDPRRYRSAIQNVAYDEHPDAALISARARPIIVDRHADDYGALRRDDPYRLNYIAQSSLDRSIYDQPTVLTNTDHIRARNVQVQLANATITSITPFAELHPKLTYRGRYPIHFREPILVGKLMDIDDLRLERIQLEYGIPILGSKRLQICALIEYLGAVRLGKLLRGPRPTALRRP
ncbi:hypothetical protein B0A48_04031 [Cryoendolithus antarcticus]|uniref:Uncharacterized protein n=1 Tax=Cryoendolithus antarcticus TaxID=1507870 RepID=A0A1V8THK9_9PEZI|nr:hypothetical protein B0A48_04031 [Cryoendolithus antarcticus]